MIISGKKDMDEVNYKKEKENNDYTSNRYENYINRNINDNKIKIIMK